MADMTTLGALLDATGGSIKTGPFGTALKAAEYTTEGVPVISVGEVGHGYLRLHERTPRVTGSTLDRLSEYVLRTGDVVFGRKGAVERSAWVRPDEDGFFLGSDGIRVRFGALTSARFMAFQFRRPEAKDWLVQHAAGTTMASMNQTILARLPIVLPDFPTQRAIAEVLGALDDKIAANLQACQLVDDLCRAVVAQATINGRKSRLRDLLVLHYGKSLPATQRRTGGVTVIGSGGPTGWHDTPLVDRPGVVLGRKGTVGAVHWSDGPHYPIDTTYYVEPLGDLTSEVLFYLLREVRLADLNSDSAVPGLNREEAYAQWTSVPTDPASLAGDLRTKFDLMAALRREMTTLTSTRDELLPLLMSGKIRVKDAEKATEGVL